MTICNDLSKTILEMDVNAANIVANIFRNELDNMVLTGYPLSDSYVYGYSKCVKLILKMLLGNEESKKDTIKHINGLDLRCYDVCSCKSCFNKGFLQGIYQFKIQLRVK